MDEVPPDPLIYVPSNTSRDLDKDLDEAKIPKWTPEGKVDFHACRVAYTTFVFEAGASIKEAQTLARHSTPILTANTYGRTRENRLHDVAESVGEMVKPAPIYDTFMTQPKKAMAAGTENTDVTDGYVDTSVQDKERWRRRGSNPLSRLNQMCH